VAVRVENQESEILEERELYSWKAVSRVHKMRGKDFYSTVIVLALLISVILFFIDGAIPVIALASLVFLFYVLGTVPPGMVKHVITSWGIESEGRSWPWTMMTRFWIEGKEKNRMMIVELAMWWPRHLRFMLGDLSEEKLQELMQEYVVEDKPRENWLDRASGWVERKVRLTPESS